MPTTIPRIINIIFLLAVAFIIVAFGRYANTRPIITDKLPTSFTVVCSDCSGPAEYWLVNRKAP